AVSRGFDALSDAELLAIIFNTGIRNVNVVELSRRILDDNDGHLSKLVRMRVGDITRRYKGIGPAKAITLLAALELGIRAAKDENMLKKQKIVSSADVYMLMHPRMQWLDHEEFWVVYLSRANEVIGEHMVGKGGLDATVVDVRVIMREALQLSASAMALVHNHPSGTLRPSPQDCAVTEKLAQAANIFDIRIIDHVIIGASKGYFSFCDEGLL
ncbi:MAG: DNA repair protein RadC, partial [Muribaculaceae bacterium]|nr:DNA repair protein RadC [Muribaculaceae bacterium]